jgi:hypothetical protein
MGFKSEGNSEQDVEIYTDGHRAVIVRDVINIAGNYTYAWSAYDEMVFYPEAEIGSDYLGCP